MTSTLDDSEKEKAHSVSVDLNNDASLLIDIPDALCERDKTTLSSFQKPDFSVPRQHEDFIWLHDTLVETEDYAGLIIPPAPPKPDFESPREKMHKLGEGEATMTKEEYAKMKQELEAEYLAVFKKTVQVHEVFLQRLSSHPILSKDRNFQIFLEYDQDLSVRRKNAKETFGSFFKNMVKNQRLHCQGREDDPLPQKLLEKLADLFEKLRKVEGRVASDEELKLTELLRYYMRDIQAAKDLLYRRARALADYENSNKALDKARLKKLTSFKGRRVVAFRKNLIEMAELEIKHAKNNMSLLQGCIELLKSS
ncbi:unnamed protein product [Coregonus sp. 'balchen']|nr:unnamed protein product [Coregonus sp. 'balchen']